MFLIGEDASTNEQTPLSEDRRKTHMACAKKTKKKVAKKTTKKKAAKKKKK